MGPRRRERAMIRLGWRRGAAAASTLVLLIGTSGVGPGGPAARADTGGSDQVTGSGGTSSQVSVAWSAGLVGKDNQTVVAPRDPNSPESFMSDDFKNLKVTVSQTQNLAHQAVTVNWTGGKPTGVVRNAGGVAFVAAKIPLPEGEQWIANVRKFVAGLNAMGITAWYDAGGRGISEKHYAAYQTLAERGELNARAFWTTIRQPATPEQVGKVLAEIQQHRPFQGNDYFENIGWGESIYQPATTNLLRNDFVVKPEDMREVRRIMQAIAESGMFLNAHVEMENAIEAYLGELEELNKVEPIKGLRWVLSHLDQVSDAQLARMKRLGMYAGLHSRPLIQGALMHKVHGERAWDMPPFKRVQDSGIVWGLGSDATAVTTSNPFYTLWFAVTGRMVGSRKVNRQTISREQALIAHTRSNAFFVFQESNLGSIQPGKYADLVVLDRDYFTAPAQQIKDIKPLMTMVGGKIVYRAR